MAWRVGMKVVCVDDNPMPGHSYPDPLPKKGEVYTVIGSYRATIGIIALEMAELPRTNAVRAAGPAWRGHAAFRFRPLVDRSTDTGFSILADIRDGKRRVADEPVDAETLREMEHALADAGYMPPDRYVEKWGRA